jgi:hypothetical protein
MAQPQKTVQQPVSVAKKRQPGFGYTPHTPSSPRPAGRVAARAVGSFVPKLTRTAFEKFGFSTAALLTDWAQIVGPQLALTTSPDRIKWPKSVDQDMAGGRTGPRSGATLHISVEPARALDVQYKTQLIIDRINSYFGYRAVGDLRIVQSRVAVTPPMPSRPRAPIAAATPDPVLGTIADEGLRAALERMQQGMLARRG